VQAKPSPVSPMKSALKRYKPLYGLIDQCIVELVGPVGQSDFEANNDVKSVAR
jgi:hypothetical protein